MVNNNSLITQIENKKPFETVYELKNYEIKTSKLSVAARAKVINKSGGNYVSENREGYGPCYVCEKPTQWTDLYVSCPVARCSDREPGYWSHASCVNSRMEVSNKANLRCKKCRATYQIGCWRFACSTHGGTHEGITRSSFRRALSIVLGSDDCDEVITDLGAYIADPKHKKEWNN